MRAFDVVDLDLAADVGAPEPELPRGPQRMAEGERRAQAERRPRAVRGRKRRAVPQLEPEWALRQRVLQSASQLAGPAHARLLDACRSGLTRTTSQASPHFSSAQMT